MSLLKIGKDKFPEWSEIENLNLLDVDVDYIAQSSSPKFAVFVTEGECRADQKTLGTGESHYFVRNSEDIKLEGKFKAVLVEGRWEEEIGTSGFFVMNNSTSPKNSGDPVSYHRETDFDNHYHDFDEVWIILKGSAVAVSEGVQYQVKAGDCLLTRMGEHHDMPEVIEELHGIWFETTLRGKKRQGHLWNHTHGSPSENKAAL